ncbi:MAG: zinc carboxypeptidase [Firmicutes bacterium]|jgi:murein tripeptide amidase MpaA|nr:zinc carboxypeptidase [Bacillota bacterium]
MLEFKYDSYFTYQELTSALQTLADKHADQAELISLGVSPQGRHIWLMEISDDSERKAEDKPAYYIDANHHAGEVTGSMVALHTIDYLLSNQEKPEVAQMLKRYTFYIIPRVSPDGAEVYLTTPESLRSAPRLYPEPELQPGLQPEDIDGNGHIMLMRFLHPYGEWKVSEDDERLMVKRRPDEEEGQFYRVFQEGMLVDWNKSEPEVAAGKWGLDFNRNFPCHWGVESKQPGAGTYPLSEPETKAVADFILAHPNIASASTLHTTGGVILRPPGIKSEKQAPKLDVEIFKAIGEMATEETGYPCINIYDEFFSDPSNFSSGAFDDWLYGHLGIPAYTIELWDLANRAGLKDIWPRKPKTQKVIEEDNKKIMAYNDEALEGKGFMPWTKFDHPQLGEVEIGGYYTKTVVQNCPPKFLLDECEKVSRFMLRHAKTLPRLAVDSLRAEQVDKNTYAIKLKLSNAGYLPTNLTQEALNLKAVKAIEVEIEADLVDGQMKKKKIGHLAGRAGRSGSFSGGGFRKRKDPEFSQDLTWLVRAQAGEEISISINSQKAGKLVLNLVI